MAISTPFYNTPEQAELDLQSLYEGTLGFGAFRSTDMEEVYTSERCQSYLTHSIEKSLGLVDESRRHAALVIAVFHVDPVRRMWNCVTCDTDRRVDSEDRRGAVDYLLESTSGLPGKQSTPAWDALSNLAGSFSIGAMGGEGPWSLNLCAGLYSRIYPGFKAIVSVVEVKITETPTSTNPRLLKIEPLDLVGMRGITAPITDLN